jgi:collagen type VII alpha
MDSPKTAYIARNVLLKTLLVTLFLSGISVFGFSIIVCPINNFLENQFNTTIWQQCNPDLDGISKQIEDVAGQAVNYKNGELQLRDGTKIKLSGVGYNQVVPNLAVENGVLVAKSGGTGLTPKQLSEFLGITNGQNGVDGQDGRNGANGTNGVNGLQGNTGSQGIAGKDGQNGVPGPQGIAGTNGTNGTAGATGPIGLTGATGSTGPQGIQGPIGITGATGPQGLIGLTGATGPQGPSGVITASSPLNYNGGNQTLSLAQATTSADGYLSGVDFTTFNSKQNALTAGSGIGILGSTISNIGVLTASNGLTSLSGNVTLGGTLTQLTNIVTAGYNLTFTGSGNIGIGNASPSEKLDITGNIRFSGDLKPNGLAGTSGQILLSQGAGVSPIWSNTPACSTCFVNGGNSFGGLATLGTLDNNNLRFITNGQSRLSLTSTGEVVVGQNAPFLLGTTSYTYKTGINAGGLRPLGLTSNNVDASIDFENTAPGGRRYNFGSTANGSGAGAGYVVFDQTAYDVDLNDLERSTRLKISPNGNIGFGIRNPTARLEINNNGAEDYLNISSFTGAQGDIFKVLNNSNVGLGVLNPTEKLDVAGNIQFSGDLRPNGLTGNIGQFLISQGSGSSPIWDNLLVDLSTQVSGVLAVSNGGTGLSSSPTNGQLLIGNAGGYTLGNLSGTNSVTGNGTTNPFNLVGDNAAPGNGYFYGTNGSGVKGFYNLGTSILADNGLTNNSGTLQLGGTLVQNTTIDGAGAYNLDITNLQNGQLQATNNLTLSGNQLVNITSQSANIVAVTTSIGSGTNSFGSTGGNQIAIGENNSLTDGFQYVTGTGNNLVGQNNYITGSSNNLSALGSGTTQLFITGFDNTPSSNINVTNSFVVGGANQFAGSSDTTDNYIIGYKNNIQSESNAWIFGRDNVVKSAPSTYNYIFGNNNLSYRNNNFSIGQNLSTIDNNIIDLGLSDATKITLDSTGRLTLRGALSPNGNDGTTGQVLTSQGVGIVPVWSDAGSLLTAGAGVTISGNTISSNANNGLSISSGVTQLGGQLLQATTIDKNGFNIGFNGAGRFNINSPGTGSSAGALNVINNTSVQSGGAGAFGTLVDTALTGNIVGLLSGVTVPTTGSTTGTITGFSSSVSGTTGGSGLVDIIGINTRVATNGAAISGSAIGFQVGTPGGSGIPQVVGGFIRDQTGGTSNANLLLGPSTVPTSFGSWSIYNLTTRNNFMGGNTAFGGGTTSFSPTSAVDINGSLTARGISAPATSAATTGRLYFDSTANKFKCSENTLAYVDCFGGPTSLSNLTAATATNTIANANNAQTWNWLLTGATNGLNISEATASTTGTGYLLNVGTIASSTAKPFRVLSLGNAIIDTTSTSGLVLGNTTGATGITERVGTGNYSLDGVGASTYTVGTSTTTGTIDIGGTAQTGGINIGSSTGLQTITIGKANGTGSNNSIVNIGQVIGNTVGTPNSANSVVNIGTALGTVNAAFTGSNTINVGNSQNNTTLNLGSGAGSHTINIGGVNSTANLTTGGNFLATSFAGGGNPWKFLNASGYGGPGVFTIDVGLNNGGVGFLTTSATGALLNTGALSRFELTNTATNVELMALNNAGNGYSFRVNDNGTYTDSSPFQIDANGNVGVGVLTANNKLELNQGTAGNSGLRFTQLTSASAAGSTGAKVLSVDANGDVVLVTDSGTGSISTLAPATAAATIDNTNFAQTWNWSTATTQNPLSLSGTSLTTGSLLNLTGGTYSSGASLNISQTGGSAIISNTPGADLTTPAGNTLNVVSGTIGIATFDSGTTGAVNIGTSANPKIVTVGNTNTTSTLNLRSGSGKISAISSTLGVELLNNAVSWTAISDRTTKENLVVVGDALAKINTLTGYNYNYKAEFGDSISKHNGLIAQDVQAVLPDAVGELSNGKLGIQYDQLTALTVNAIKELNIKVDALDPAKLADGKNGLAFVNKQMEQAFDRITQLENRVELVETKNLDQDIIIKKQQVIIDGLLKRVENLEKVK